MSDYEASPQDWVADHVERYERTGGVEGGEFNGIPCVILTTTGRKTGKIRKTPLVRVPHGEGYLVVASMGGQPKHPVWYHNVVAADTVDIQIGSEKKTYRMREATPAEETDLWPQLEDMYPDYKEYRARTEGVRHIPVLIFTPV